MITPILVNISHPISNWPQCQPENGYWLWVAFTIVVHVGSIANNWIVILYLWRKPLGQQTVLDKAYIVLFASTVCMFVARLPQLILYHMTVQIGEGPGWAYAWLLVTIFNFLLVVFVGCIVLNSLLVYLPHWVEEEQSVLLAFYVMTVTVAGMATGYSYFCERLVPPAFIKLTNCPDAMMPTPSLETITCRGILFLFAPATFIGFKAGFIFVHDFKHLKLLFYFVILIWFKSLKESHKPK